MYYSIILHSSVYSVRVCVRTAFAGIIAVSLEDRALKHPSA